MEDGCFFFWDSLICYILNIDLSNCFVAVILLEYGAIRKKKSWIRDGGSIVSGGRVAWDTQFASR